MFSVIHCIVSASGIRPDPKKIESITQAPHPYYCSQYIPNYSTITQPLWELTKSNSPFQWNEAQEAAFQKLKITISSAPVLAHYNLNAPTKLVVDASPWAVGTILLVQQLDTNYRPVAYGSRSLTSTEVKYGHIEREALALVYGCEHFHMYLYGRKFELEYALVLIDYYSRWAEVEITTTTTTTKSAKVLKWLDFVCKPWLSSHITNRQRKIFHLCRIPTHPQSMGNQALYCHRILPAGKWVGRAVQQNPVEVYSLVLGRGKKLDGDKTHCSPKNDPRPLPAPLLPLPTDPSLRTSTRHRKPPDFFHHT